MFNPIIYRLFVLLALLALTSCTKMGNVSFGLMGFPSANNTKAPVVSGMLQVVNVTSGIDGIHKKSFNGQVSFKNSGNGNLTGFNFKINSDDYALNGGTCEQGGSILAGANCTLAFLYTPTGFGTLVGKLTVEYFDGSDPKSLEVTLSNSSRGAPGTVDITFIDNQGVLIGP